jgi:hypothetical protein
MEMLQMTSGVSHVTRRPPQKVIVVSAGFRPDFSVRISLIR